MLIYICEPSGLNTSRLSLVDAVINGMNRMVFTMVDGASSNGNYIARQEWIRQPATCTNMHDARSALNFLTYTAATLLLLHCPFSQRRELLPPSLSGRMLNLVWAMVREG